MVQLLLIPSLLQLLIRQPSRIAELRQPLRVRIGRAEVRRLPGKIAISAALHLAGVTWLATHSEPVVPPAPAAGATHREILGPATRGHDRAARSASPPARSARTASPRGDPLIRTSPSDTPRGGATAHAHPDQAGSHLLAMRTPEGPKSERPEAEHGPPQPQLRVDQPLPGALAAAPSAAPPARSSAEPSARSAAELHPRGGGRYRSDQGSFTLDMDQDGTAHLTNAPVVQPDLASPIRPDIDKALSHWSEDPFHDAEAARRQQSSEYKALGDDEKPTASKVVLLPLGASFDVTDNMMRSRGQDPYASKKLQALDATRDERAQLGAAHRRDQLAHAPQLMKASLDDLWASGFTLAAKKRAVFELWDDCAETGAPDLVEAARQARAFVIGFIQAKLPPGSAAAFSTGELAQLNAHRRSRAVFAPYSS